MNRSKTNSDEIFYPDNSRTLVEYKTCKLRNIDKKKMTLNGDVTNGKLVVNFRPTEGGFRLDLEGQFLACLLLGTQAMGKPLGELINLKVDYFLTGLMYTYQGSARWHWRSMVRMTCSFSSNQASRSSPSDLCDAMAIGDSSVKKPTFSELPPLLTPPPPPPSNLGRGTLSHQARRHMVPLLSRSPGWDRHA